MCSLCSRLQFDVAGCTFDPIRPHLARVDYHFVRISDQADRLESLLSQDLPDSRFYLVSRIWFNLDPFGR